jgi:hypothetical protein
MPTKPLQPMETTTASPPSTHGRLTAAGVAIGAMLTANAHADTEVDAANDQPSALPSA